MTRGTPARAEKSGTRRGRVQKWTSALKQMSNALNLLDDSDAPRDVGAHLDLAIVRLTDEIEKIVGKPL